MNPEAIWSAAQAACAVGGRACLLVVVAREGSAPNGPGAKLVLTDRGDRVGTVGGGASEFKLVTAAEPLLATGAPPEVITLYHYECAPDTRSGMICGGSQTYVRLYLGPADLPAIAAAQAAEREQREVELVLTPAGMVIGAAVGDAREPEWQPGSAGDWRYAERLGVQDMLTIIGAGHVGLALTRVAAQIDFHVTVLDNRQGLGTYEANCWAHAKRIIDYAHVVDHVPEGPRSYVCIMTYGVNPDRDVLRRLVQRPVRYLGMLGSIAKVRTVMRELEAEGIPRAVLERVHAPLGVPIGSRTPEEIAISIAADLIRARRVGNGA